jgi:hypothetical protein
VLELAGRLTDEPPAVDVHRGGPCAATSGWGSSTDAPSGEHLPRMASVTLRLQGRRSSDLPQPSEDRTIELLTIGFRYIKM